MSERPVSDADQRRRALDISRSFIVQAPAGSGKTELLTQRFLRLLASVRHPEELYAITFTRKAAAEMRQRIVMALAAARGPRPQASHAQLTWQLAGAALQRDQELGWHIDANPNRLRIQTFDSLAHALARQLPLLSEFGATPNTTEQARPYYVEAARATLRRLEDDDIGNDLENLLVHLDGRLGQLEGLLADMLARRDQWLPPVMRAPDGHELDTALGDAVASHLVGLAAGSTPAWLAELCDLAKAAAESARGQPRGSADLAAWQSDDTPLAPRWDDLPRWRALADLLLTGKGEVRRTWDARSGFPAPSEKGIDAQEKQRRKDAKFAIEQVASELTVDDERRERWHALRMLPLRGLGDEQQGVLASLLRVLVHAVAELTLAFRAGGEVDFAETQMRAQRALGTPDAPSDAALALDYRLHHLLVDEFQDTSSSQHRLVATLTANWQPGDGRTLFAVGDPMQSIYRFREAEVGLFLAARANGLGDLPLEPLTLAVNFRSTRGVVGWVNDCFARLFPSRVDIGRGAVPFARSEAFSDDPADDAVVVHPLAGDDPAAEARLVVELVRCALAETGDGRIAILARARRHLADIATALNAAGIAFQAVDVDPLGRQPVVRDLYHLTRAVLHPADRLAWLVVLRAPWIGLDLPALLAIAEGTSCCIPERLSDPALHTRLDADSRRRVERLLAVVGPRLPSRGRRPLREWIEGIWLELGGAAVASTREQDDAQAFLALLEQHETAGDIADFARLEAALADLYAAPDPHADGRVQLMTMHKSKGLEFDTVILPGLGRRPGSARSELLYWLERTAADGQVSLMMAPVRSARDAAEPISDYLRSLARDKASLETTRLLYVAATRAKRRLHLLGHVTIDDEGGVRRPAAGSLLHSLWPVVEPLYADLEPGVAEPAIPAAGRSAQRLPADWQPDLAALNDHDRAAPEADGEREPIEFAWASDTARHVGTLVHRHLERIANDGIDAWPVERVASLAPVMRVGLSHLGVEPGELDNAVDKSLRALRNAVSHDVGRWILGANREARCEWPLTVSGDAIAHYVIDRSFVDDGGTRWIIDYKTGEHLDADRDAFLDRELERYRAQLDNYARIVRMLDPRPIRLGLYFPLLADWRTWDYPG